MKQRKKRDSTSFTAFMTEIWGEDKDGLYDTLFDARKAIEQFDGRCLWPSRYHTEPGHVWEFPDGSRIAMNSRGTAVCNLGFKPSRKRRMV